MLHLTKKLKKRIELEQRRAAFDKWRIMLENEGKIPKSPKLLLRRYSKFLEIAYACLIGIMVAEIGLVLVYFLFVKILHLSF